MKIEIRPPKNPEEFRYIEQIQRDAWGAPDIDITPTHVCVATFLASRCVYLAFHNDKPIGFVWGLLGVKDGEIILHSHQLGVLREYQNKNVGFLLKLKQREYALSRGIKLIRWTFDPLQSKNAYFNFNKLGVICREYMINLYGEIRDELNRGLPSDRFYVEWYIDTPRVSSRIKGEKPPTLEKLPRNIPTVNSVEKTNGLLRTTQIEKDLQDEFLLVEVPRNYIEMKKASPSLVLEWRLNLREIFTEYLSRKYTVVDVIMNEEKTRIFYVLSSMKLKEILTENWWEIIQ